MVPFEGNQNQHLRLGQEEPVRMWHHRFRSRKAGVGGGPPLLVLLVLISDDVSATTVATFRFYACRGFEDICSSSVHQLFSGDIFSSCP